MANKEYSEPVVKRQVVSDAANVARIATKRMIKKGNSGKPLRTRHLPTKITQLQKTCVFSTGRERCQPIEAIMARDGPEGVAAFAPSRALFSGTTR